MSDEMFELYMEVCKRVFERMRRENSWPWRDSPEMEDVIESEDKPNDV